jgi:ketosteroid isomerase-like protein
MKKTRRGLLTVALMISFVDRARSFPQGSQGGTQGNPAVAAQIEKLERDRAAAVVKGDVAKLEQETADTAIFIDRNGRKLDKTQTIRAIKSGDIKLTSNQLSDLEVYAYGDTAVITGKSFAKGTISGKEIAGPVMFTRVYVKKDGRWQSVAYEQTPIVP